MQFSEEQIVSKLIEEKEAAVAELFAHFRPPLERMVDFRLDRRLYGRVDSSDVLQEAYLTISKRYQEFIEHQGVSFFVWIRQLTFQTLLLIHRRHFAVQKRSVTHERSLNWSDNSNVTSHSIASFLAGNLTTPSNAAIREEQTECLRAALSQMDEMDREVLALRHFEQLSNKEVSEVLEISKTAASNRYVRALERLKKILDEVQAEF